MNSRIKIQKGKDDCIKVLCPYNPLFVGKIKAIDGRRWYPEEKYWSFPDTYGTLKKILRVFEGERVEIEPALQNVIARDKVPHDLKIFLRISVENFFQGNTAIRL